MKPMTYGAASLAAALMLAGCGTPKEAATPDAGAAGTHRSAAQAANLKTFDDLDFRVYSGQKWDEFAHSHAADIIVHYPDGTTTTGLDAHLEKIKPQFTFAPDSRIEAHPIRLADGDFTAVEGVMAGTFTKPMTLADGTVIQPTGKAFRLSAVTLARWKDGKMTEEWLYWDNAALMTQMGLSGG